MTEKTAKTWWARIYLSGSLETVKDECRKECLERGLCVTVEPTTFIYTGGEETGAVVGLVNYPRFPASERDITERALKLAMRLLGATHQHSVLIMTPSDTFWFTKRE